VIVTQRIDRSRVYLVSKVWPTHLTFEATSGVVRESLMRMRTGTHCAVALVVTSSKRLLSRVAYVNLYLIHWPDCLPQFAWMQCNQSVPDGHFLKRCLLCTRW
jgi:diketogulonate reductase-like aldo/keto reductase